MKKLFCVLLAALLLSAVLLPVAAAPNYQNVLLLGDSITYGYGLEGSRDTCASYGNLLKAELGIREQNFANKAVNGDTSADLLALLPSLEKQISEADLIVISIGGNDLLGIIWDAIARLMNIPAVSPEQLVGVLADERQVLKLLETLTVSRISEVVVSYTVNLASIASMIRAENPDAEVIFLAQYDPFEQMTGIKELEAIVATGIKMLNNAMEKVVEASGCTYLDVYTPFVGHAAEWTNMRYLDIHPNAEGHKQIYNVLSAYLNSLSATPETTTPAPETTTPAPETTTPALETTTPAPESSPVSIDTSEPEEDNKEEGCGATVSLACLLTVLLGAAFVLKRE